MLKIRADLVGVSPLIMHNPRLANPLDEFTKQIKAISGKRGKTEEDHEEMANIEFVGSLYFGKSGPYIPGTMIHANIVRGASIDRGAMKKAKSAINVFQTEFPLIYDGPRTAEGLRDDANFRSVYAVRVQSSRVMRTRPIFRNWALRVEYVLDTEVLDYETFLRYLDHAGAVEALGDYRPIHGRYRVEDVDKEELA